MTVSRCDYVRITVSLHHCITASLHHPPERAVRYGRAASPTKRIVIAIKCTLDSSRIGSSAHFTSHL
ncbi:hypothetical protein, partial [Zeaxanthinibacter enoshimensis]|uniref:hypothetical protein n=1 Tax=Zeaxanthinibacter enoshimensis TaxID=392009 RepID=UPI0035622C0E